MTGRKTQDGSASPRNIDCGLHSGDIGYGIRTWPDGAGGEMRKPNDNSFGVAISHPSICLFQPKNKKKEVEMEVGC